jgi:hypothetical protein
MHSPKQAEAPHRLRWAYAAACLLAWLLHILASLEAQRGPWAAAEAIYQATWALWPAWLLGIAVFPWVRWLDRRQPGLAAHLAAHALAALAFGAAWQLLEFAAARAIFNAEHAWATLRQGLLSREIVGAVAYAGIAAAFTAVLQAQRARSVAVAAAQAEAALARAELAAITGKLNPHFLFNTLNTITVLTRKDPRLAEQALLQFAGMLRYVLSMKRDAAERVPLEDELEFVRNYLALESLRLGPRLKVDWALDPASLQDEVPPLSLQPLVENAIVHGVAPRTQGGSIGIRSERDAATGTLHLAVLDDGAGCDPVQLETPRAGQRQGIALAALRRRFALDFGGRARMTITTAPQAGFRVDLWIPQPA